jgi:hypothetical protein
MKTKTRRRTYRAALKTVDYFGPRLIVAGLVGLILPSTLFLLRIVLAERISDIAIVALAVYITYAIIVCGVFILKFRQVGKELEHEEEIEVKLASLSPSLAEDLWQLMRGKQISDESAHTLEEWPPLVERDYLKGWRLVEKDKALLERWAKNRTKT